MDDVPSLRRRIEELERTLREARPPVIDYLVTTDWGDGSINTSDVHLPYPSQVVMAPLHFHGVLALRRIRGLGRSSSGAGQTAQFCVGIYRALATTHDRQSPFDAPLAFELLRAFQPVQTALNDLVSLSWDTGPRSLVLDSRRGHFFVGFQGNGYADWFCPQLESYRPVAHVTSPPGSAVGDLPVRCGSIGAVDVVAVPQFVLYSDLGLRLYGDRSSDA